MRIPKGISGTAPEEFFAFTVRCTAVSCALPMAVKDPIYYSKQWRSLPREGCIAEYLLGEAAGPCHGLIHRHHANPDDPHSHTYEVCNGHHQRIHAFLRSLDARPKWKPCPHKPGTHRYHEGKVACERLLNRDLLRRVRETV